MKVVVWRITVLSLNVVGVYFLSRIILQCNSLLNNISYNLALPLIQHNSR